MQEAKQIYLPLISIVIPCFNDAEYIEQSINSALNQTYSNIEIIVVDDGSNIETKEVLGKLEPKITKLITQENKGQSVARNGGITGSKGEYILVLDSDDFFEPSFCEKAIPLFENNAEVKVVSCYTNLLYEDGTMGLFKTLGGSLEKFLCSNRALGSALFKKEDWQICGGYDEKMNQGLEDWEFYIRMVKNGGTAAIIPEALYNYRIRRNTTTDKANQVKYELLKYIYTKHKELYLDNFDLFVDNLLHRLEREEYEKIKNTKRIDFKVGKAILQPLRYLKSLLHK